MKVKVLKSWEEFETEIQNEFRKQEYSIKSGFGYPILFRGQSNSIWHLETTLERFMRSDNDMYIYYLHIEKIGHQIITFTNKNWNIPNLEDYRSWLTNDESADMYRMPAIEFMIYLRHNGYPSPLLDWSFSPYIAAYFAFRETTNNAESVAIFSYTQQVGNRGDSGLEKKPKIFMIDENLLTDKRHYLQQSAYTICAKEYCYNSHEIIFEDKEEQQFEVLTKYIIPSSERGKTLRRLEHYNINPYSLFGSEESLLETMFLRNYVDSWLSDSSDVPNGFS